MPFHFPVKEHFTCVGWLLSIAVKLINMHKRMGNTFVYVTHDQADAISMADVTVLMDNGKIIRHSNPGKLYHGPVMGVHGDKSHP